MQHSSTMLVNTARFANAFLHQCCLFEECLNLHLLKPDQCTHVLDVLHSTHFVYYNAV